MLNVSMPTGVLDIVRENVELFIPGAYPVQWLDIKIEYHINDDYDDEASDEPLADR